MYLRIQTHLFPSPHSFSFLHFRFFTGTSFALTFISDLHDNHRLLVTLIKGFATIEEPFMLSQHSI